MKYNEVQLPKALHNTHTLSREERNKHNFVQDFVSGSNESMYILEGFGGVYFGGCFRLIVSDKSNLSLTAYSFKALKGK